MLRRLCYLSGRPPWSTTNVSTSQAGQATVEAQPAKPPKQNSRKRLLALLGLTTALAAAGYGAYYYTVARFHQES